MKIDNSMMHIPKMIPPIAIFTIGSFLPLGEDDVSRLAMKCAKFINNKISAKDTYFPLVASLYSKKEALFCLESLYFCSVIS